MSARMRLSKSSSLESQVELCAATIQSASWRHDQCRVSATSDELAGAEALSWYASVPKGLSEHDLKVSSPYVIQGVSATVRGQTKLMCEGEPQGGNRQAPEPPDTPGKGVGQEGR